MKKLFVVILLCSCPIIANAQWGVGAGAFANSFSQSYALGAQAAAAEAEAEARLASIRQMRIQQRERYGTREIKRLDQQEALADQKLELVISVMYSGKPRTTATPQ